MRNLLKEAIELLERDERPEAESWKERAEAELDFFPVSFVSRSDLESQGYNTAKVDDETMEDLAENMGESFTEYGGYWEAMDAITEKLEIHKHNAEPLKCVVEGCDDWQGEDEYCPAHSESMPRYCTKCGYVEAQDRIDCKKCGSVMNYQIK